MPRITSSSNRSKRMSKKPITSDKGRRNRSSVSKAKVTSADSRPSGGTAKVTGGRDASKPSGRQPRAITNGSSPAMRQLRAKAVQARRQAEGKAVRGGTKGRNLTLPNSAKAGKNLVREGAQKLRVIGDSGKVRAAQVAGRKAVAAAQARRGAKAASERMSNTLKAARAGRNLLRGAAGISRGGAAAAGLQAYNTGDSTLKAAQKRGDYKPKQGPAVTGPSQAKFNKSNFNDAFRKARSSGAKEFTWRGKRYNTKKKGEK